MTDFWLSSGHHLLERNADGLLVATDEFLKLYLARPEVVPPDDACSAERGLHACLLARPREAVARERIEAIADPDARENWQLLVEFRDRLTGHASLEAAYLDMMRRGVGRTPPLFINQLVHVILRNILDGEADAHVLRAAELLFRPQRLTLEAGGMLLADEEVVDGMQADMHISPLVAMLGEHKARNLDVLGEASAAQYFERSDRFDMVLDFRPGGRGRSAFARVIERWIAHMLGHQAEITPREQIEGEDWFWFIGLDAEATRIANALWQGRDVDEGALERIVALYSLVFTQAPPGLRRPIYLVMAVTPQRTVRVKPQNLLVGLPPELLEGRRG